MAEWRVLQRSPSLPSIVRGSLLSACPRSKRACFGGRIARCHAPHTSSVTGFYRRRTYHSHVHPLLRRQLQGCCQFYRCGDATTGGAIFITFPNHLTVGCFQGASSYTADRPDPIGLLWLRSARISGRASITRRHRRDGHLRLCARLAKHIAVIPTFHHRHISGLQVHFFHAGFWRHQLTPPPAPFNIKSPASRMGQTL